MPVDSGAIVNLMLNSLYKKLGGMDEELIKTNMTVSGVGGGDPIGAKGVALMELTVGSKTIATAFFVSEVQGNFSRILGRDWIHDNQCVPATSLRWTGLTDLTHRSDRSAGLTDQRLRSDRLALCCRPAA